MTISHENLKKKEKRELSIYLKYFKNKRQKSNDVIFYQLNITNSLNIE